MLKTIIYQSYKINFWELYNVENSPTQVTET